MTPGQFSRWKEKRRLTIAAAAIELGCGEQSVADYSKGRRMIPVSVARMCWALRCIDILQWRLQCSEAVIRQLSEAIAKVARQGDLEALQKLRAEVERRQSRMNGAARQ